MSHFDVSSIKAPLSRPGSSVFLCLVNYVPLLGIHGTTTKSQFPTEINY